MSLICISCRDVCILKPKLISECKFDHQKNILFCELQCALTLLGSDELVIFFHQLQYPDLKEVNDYLYGFACTQSLQAFFSLMRHVIGPLTQQLQLIQSVVRWSQAHHSLSRNVKIFLVSASSINVRILFFFVKLMKGLWVLYCWLDKRNNLKSPLGVPGNCNENFFHFLNH